MDKIKGMADGAMGSGFDKHLKDIDFPASKDEVCNQLAEKGVPDQVVDKIRNTNTSQFDSVDDLKSKANL